MPHALLHERLCKLLAIALLATAAPACGGAIPTPTAANAPPPPALTKTDAPPTREAVAIKGSDLVRGRSRLVVLAPIDKVRRHVLNFDRYAEFMPHYSFSRILTLRDDGGRQVMMEVEAIGGLIKMWTKIEMPPPRMEGNLEVHESEFVEGNVDDFKAIWRLRRLNDSHTELSLEVFLEPSLPLPDSLINSENVGGAFDGVIAMRNRIEGRPVESDDDD